MRYVESISRKLGLSGTEFEVVCNLPVVRWTPDQFPPVPWSSTHWGKLLRSSTDIFLAMNNFRPILKLPIFAEFVWGSAIFQFCSKHISPKEGLTHLLTLARYRQLGRLYHKNMSWWLFLKNGPHRATTTQNIS